MRILVLTNMYPPHHYGGYELSCRDTVQRMRRRGHEVEVLTSTVSVPGVVTDADQEALDGVRRWLHLYWVDHQLVSPGWSTARQWERENQRALAHRLDSFAPDIVAAWHMGAMSLGLLTTVIERDLPLLLSVCDDWLVYGPKLDVWTRRLGMARRGRLLGRLLGSPPGPSDLGDHATVCFISGFTRDRALVQSPWSLRSHTVVFNGFDTDRFPITEPDDRPWRGRVLYVGRLDERKGIRTLLDAVGLAEGVTLRIDGGGDPDLEREIVDRVAEPDLSGRVAIGRSRPSELASCYLEADVCVFPPEWDEPFGLVPLEAMACATPVVATGTGGSGEYLRDGVNCLLVPPRAPAAIASAIDRLGRDPDLRRQLVVGGLHTASRLTVDQFAETLEAWHEAVATRFAHGRPPERTL